MVGEMSLVMRLKMLLFGSTLVCIYLQRNVHFKLFTMKKLVWLLSVILVVACSDSVDLVETNGVLRLSRVDCIAQTSDQGLLIAGVFDNKVTLIKTDADFRIVWTKTDYDWGTLLSSSGWGSSFYLATVNGLYPQNGGGYVCSVSVLQGGCVVNGSTLLARLDNQGIQVAKTEVSGSYSSLASGPGYLLWGPSLMGLDSSFGRLWTKSLETNYSLTRMIVATDAGFAATGTYNSDQIFLKKYNSTGNETASYTYTRNGVSIDEGGFDIRQLSDKGFLIAGRTRKATPPYNIACQILRTNQNGDTLWTRRFGAASNEWFDQILSVNSNEYVVKGTRGFPPENSHTILMRLDGDGNVKDSLTTESLQLHTSLNNNYCIKVQTVDANRVRLSKVGLSDLFH